jgi:uncharacterized membrane protein YphA (DoxX/SURF4 family)
LSLLAIAIGLLSTVVAFALLRLIGLFTNLFYYHRWSTVLVSPAALIIMFNLPLAVVSW